MESLNKEWQLYIETKNHAVKEKLIIHYAPLVKFVAGRLVMLVGQHVDYDDLIGYGIFGLIDAIEKFDTDKGVKFETYASLRIRGAILDSIRKMDWVPRTLRQKNKQAGQAYAQLEETLGRAPTDQELADKLEMTVAETQELMRKSSVLGLVSLDEYLDQNYEAAFNGGLTTQPQDSPENQAEKSERQRMLADAINKLTEKERLVISLYYFEDLTLKEISSIMKVSESRISQIHSKAVIKLQGKLGKFKSVLLG